MTPLLALLAGVLTVAAVAGVWAYERLLCWNRLTRRRVIVNLRDGQALEGLLLARRGPLLVLRDATLHTEGRAVPVDGEAVVERDRVAWMQLHGRAGS